MSKGDKVSIELVGGPPWGFRLGGGADFGCPLEIAKLRKKGKASVAGLVEGDVVTFIDHQDVARKSHGDAMKIIEVAGPTLRLEIIKGIGPSAELSSSQLSDTLNMSQTANILTNQQPHSAETMMTSSREPSISTTISEPPRERSIPRTLTVVPAASKKIEPNAGATKIPVEPWTVDVTSYEFADNGASENVVKNASLRTPQFKQPPPTSPKPKFKANTLPRQSAGQQNSSCPLIPTWGTPPANPTLQHLWNQSTPPTQSDRSVNVQAKAPPMFKVAKVDAKPHKWQPTAMRDIAYDNPRHQFNTNGMMETSQASPAVSMSQSYEQPNHTMYHSPAMGQPNAIPPMYHSPAIGQSHAIPEPPPLPPASTLSPRKPANHVPGMVNPLICDDSHGDFGVNNIVRPDTEGERAKSKKMYSDSAFYDSPSMVYPTIQEQVAMAKEISTFLESNQNQRSRGGRMFSKRKQRADEWSMNSMGQRRDMQQTARYDSLNTGPPALSMQRKEFGYNHVRHHPDPIKSKINAAELEQIQHNQDFLCKHDSLPPNIAFDINQALSTSQGKAGQFFEKRKQRAEKYVVDENSRKTWQPTNTNLQSHIDQPDSSRLGRSYKSPWEAAAEGRLDAAFQQNGVGSYPPSQQPPGFHQPLNVITNQPEFQQPQSSVGYNNVKPVTPVYSSPAMVRSPAAMVRSPAAMGNAMPKQKTRLEMMLEGTAGSDSTMAYQQSSSHYSNHPAHQGVTRLQPSPAVSNVALSASPGYSPVAPPVAEQPFARTSLRRPKDYMRRHTINVTSQPNPAVSAF